MNNKFNSQDVSWALLFALNGLAWGFPLLSLTALSMGGHLTWFNHPELSFLAFLGLFSSIWIRDYENNYLPKWVLRHVTFS